jgi:hypothetical protein
VKTQDAERACPDGAGPPDNDAGREREGTDGRDTKRDGEANVTAALTDAASRTSAFRPIVWSNAVFSGAGPRSLDDTRNVPGVRCNT